MDGSVVLGDTGAPPAVTSLSDTQPLGQDDRICRLGKALWAHKWLVLAASIAVVIAGWQGALWGMGPVVAVDQVRRGELIETVVASGHVETPFRVEISSQITGTVVDVPVQEGQTVTKGQILVSLDPRELKAEVLQAQGAVAQAEARMRQLEELTLPTAQEAGKEARATILNLQRSFDRTADLADKGYATRAALDEARKNLDVARVQVRTSDLQVHTASPGGSDYVMAQTQLGQARASLDTSVSHLGYATITAPRDGLLITRNVERGVVAQIGKALLVLAPAGETQLILQIDERNLGKVALGQTAIASADSYPDQKFPAVVSYINPGVDISRASVEVKLTAADSPAYLRQDMTVSVDIEVARRPDALTLADNSVRDVLSPTPWVMAVADGRTHRQAVRLGLRGNTRIEILEGLAEGDAVVGATSMLPEGKRVRPIQP